MFDISRARQILDHFHIFSASDRFMPKLVPKARSLHRFTVAHPNWISFERENRAILALAWPCPFTHCSYLATKNWERYNIVLLVSLCIRCLLLDQETQDADVRRVTRSDNFQCDTPPILDSILPKNPCWIRTTVLWDLLTKIGRYVLRFQACTRREFGRSQDISWRLTTLVPLWRATVVPIVRRISLDTTCVKDKAPVH